MPKPPMSEEFKKSGENSAVSSDGFSIALKGTGGLVYSDEAGEVTIDTEWLFKPTFGILLYEGSHRRKGLDKKDPAQLLVMYERVVRALQFLGYRVEKS